MNITKLEQSGFILETDNGHKLAVDIGSYTAAARLDGIHPNSMIVTHIHADHFLLENIRKLSPKNLYLNEECIEALGEESLTSQIVKVKVGDEIDLGGIKIKLFDVDHGPNVRLVPRENFGMLIEADSKKIYFAGDMFNESGIDVSDLEVDIALIPVGTFYTFGPQEAVDFAKKFKRVGKVMPMHYEKNPETKGEFARLATEAGFILM